MTNLKSNSNKVGSNKSPFFSIVIPAYNCANLISYTLDSVLSQEFLDFEVIVVNDGSSDGTSDIIDHYASRMDNITIIHQDNRGEGGARNKGIFAATGRYIAFLDQDDLWFPWTLKTYHDVLSEHRYPAILIASGQEFHEVEETNKIAGQNRQTICFSNFLSAAGENYLPAGTPGTVVKAEEARRVNGLSEERVIGIDQEFFLKMGTAEGVIHVTSPVTVAIRRHGGNLQKNTYMAIQGIFQFIDKELRQCYPGGDNYRWARRSIISRSARTISMRSLQDGHFSDGWKIYLSTFNWNIQLGRFRYLVAFPCIWLYKKWFSGNHLRIPHQI